MAVRGQRFELDLSDDEGQFTARPIQENEIGGGGGGFIGEIKERDPTTVTAPPSAPKFKATTKATGFPEHRKRPSKFKQAQTNDGAKPKGAAELAQSSVQQPRGPSDHAIAHHIGKKHGINTSEDLEKQSIDQENKERLAAMSVEEIEEARRELMQNLNPSTLERLLKRANIDEDPEPQPQRQPPTLQEVEDEDTDHSKDPTSSSLKPASSSIPSQSHSPILPPDDAEPTSNHPPPSMHFPQPPRDPSTFPALDPSSPTFLTDLQHHYFPNLPTSQSPSNPTSSLSWLTTPSSSSSYDPSSTSPIPISALRFDFTGSLIPPRLAASIDVREGLHHHGLDPESAGYTIAELCMLARSTVPGQRCVAFMVLGRILFRLGSGGFGDWGEEGGKGELVQGLWECVEREHGVEVMMAEANRVGRGHESVKAYATEGVWLWRRGLEDGRGTGGRERGIGRDEDRNTTR